MQILMGAFRTTIRIDESRVSADALVKFVYSHFSYKVKNKNHLIVEYSPAEHHGRIFLIKWLFHIYKNTTNYDTLGMEEILLNRLKKPLEIRFNKKLIQAEDTKKEKRRKEHKRQEKTKEKLELRRMQTPYVKALFYLEVNESDEMKLIDKKYKKLLKQYHPDKVHAQGDEAVFQYTEKFKSLQSAYTIIQKHKNIG